MEIENTTPAPTSSSQWNTVTPFSKYAAMVIFVVMPFVGFWVGMQYAPERIVEVGKIIVKPGPLETQKVSDTDVAPVSQDQMVPSDWRTFENKMANISVSFPANFVVQDGKEDFIFNTSDGLTNKDQEAFYFCDGSVLPPQAKDGGGKTCTGSEYYFVVSVSDEVKNEETIKSWGTAVEKYKQIEINGIKAWMVEDVEGANGSTSLIFERGGQTIQFSSSYDLYADIENTQKTTLVEQIVHTLKI